MRNKLNSIQRMKVTYGHVPEAEILDTVFQSDIEIIKLTMEHIDHAAFEMAVETLLSARYYLYYRYPELCTLSQLFEFLSEYDPGRCASDPDEQRQRDTLNRLIRIGDQMQSSASVFRGIPCEP